VIGAPKTDARRPALWIERECVGDEILAAIDEAEASFADAGGVAVTTESMKDLTSDIKAQRAFAAG
jgi:hypothetical protein